MRTLHVIEYLDHTYVADRLGRICPVFLWTSETHGCVDAGSAGNDARYISKGKQSLMLDKHITNVGYIIDSTTRSDAGNRRKRPKPPDKYTTRLSARSI